MSTSLNVVLAPGWADPSIADQPGASPHTAATGRPRPGLYDSHALQRYHPDRHIDRCPISAFDDDVVLVTRSAGLRRLASTTQVLSPREHAELGTPRTRLTHSLEVAYLARRLGRGIGCAPALPEVAGLAHDLGTPPFGHNGEAALDRAGATSGGYEANAQTLRVLTRGAGTSLNLTRASLDASCKYPWPRSGIGKFGVYPDDGEVFAWMRAGAPPATPCLEAEVMNWADDVAYAVHDVEDGVATGRIDSRALIAPGMLAQLTWLAAHQYGTDPQSLAAAATELATLPYQGWRDPVWTTQLVVRLVDIAVAATRARHGPGPLIRYGASLCVPGPAAALVDLLKAATLQFVIRAPDRVAMQIRQQEVLVELVERLVTDPRPLQTPYARAWARAAGEPAARRAVLDQVAALTDHQAVGWHRQHVRRRVSVFHLAATARARLVPRTTTRKGAPPR